MKRRDSALLGLMLFIVGSSVLVVGAALTYASGAERVDVDSLSFPALRVMAAPIQVATGQSTSPSALTQHLLRIGYSQAAAAGVPGTFARADESLALFPRLPEFPSIAIHWSGDTVSSITGVGGEQLDYAEIEPETVMTFEPDGWTQTLQRDTDFATIDGTVLEDALLASEDKGFLTHHGVDFVRLALVPLFHGGASTLTMQLARLNVLQDRTRTVYRKASEIGVAMALERKYSKPQMLTAYINAAYLGTSRGRQVHGFAAAAQEFFGLSEVRRLDLVQAATLVALLNQPARYLSELRSGDDMLLRQQRNRVLRLMCRNWPDRYDTNTVSAIESSPIVFTGLREDSDLESASQWFLDAANREIPRRPRTRAYASLDATLQRKSDDVVRTGLKRLGERFPMIDSRLQAALVAIDPRTGELLALTGGRSHDQSQFNRATSARRQLGSLMKPFDLAAAMERAIENHRTDLTPASIINDAPTTFTFDGRPWTPQNYAQKYAGPITVRQAIALSKNIPAVKIAAEAGFDRIAAMWQRATGTTRQVEPYPSLALGAVEETPVGMAAAYASLVNGGVTQHIRSVVRVVEAGHDVPGREIQSRRVMQADVAFVVADTLRAVLDEGTGVSARVAGFTAPAAGKTGTTDDLRDAWFAGFTPNLLVVVWVGADDNQPIGLTGAQAALPIWTEFMKAALSVRPATTARVPEGVTFADIDSETGQLATPRCPRRARQAFLTGTEPRQVCARHR